MRRAAFLDRDGTINTPAAPGSYICWVEEFRLLPGVREAVRALNRHGVLAVVITNQRAVALGLLTEDRLDRIHERMIELLAVGGAKLDAVYSCTCDDEPLCQCRKPRPGLLLQAAQDHEIVLRDSWMIGDSDVDVLAGRAAGCHTILINDVHSNSLSSAAMPELVVDSLPEAVDRIVAVLR